MRRREFITLFGGAAVWPEAARAQQQSAMRVIGFLSSRSPNESSGVIPAFREGLQETGFVEGQNAIIAFRWAEGAYERLPGLASELVNLRVAVLFAAGGPPSALAAKAATSTIPVIFAVVPDPVALGLVVSFNRPGGNVTGMSSFFAELGAKSVELLKQLMPSAAVVAYLVNPSSPQQAELYTKEAATAARTLGIQVPVLSARTEHDLDQVYAALGKLKADGLVVTADSIFLTNRDKILGLSARAVVPTIYPFREFIVAGGLMSYGASLANAYRQAGVYTGRILKGEKPADLPVMHPTKFELVINLKTAKALGLEVPPLLLARADEVIE